MIMYTAQCTIMTIEIQYVNKGGCCEDPNILDRQYIVFANKHTRNLKSYKYF